MTVQIDTTSTAEFDIVSQSVSSSVLEEVARLLAVDPYSGEIVFNKDQQNFRSLVHKGLRYIYYLSLEGDQTVVTILSVTRAETERNQRLQKLFSNIAKTVGALGVKSID